MKRPWELQIGILQVSEKPVYVQIADAMIDAIRSGRLAAGTALPGSRQLAAALGVNRNTLVEALDILNAEGWIVSRERSGSFVCAELPKLGSARFQQTQEPAATRQELKPRIVFDDGFPDTSIAPIRELSRAYRQLLERGGRWHVLGYADPDAPDAFQQEVIRMLNLRRGMQLRDDQLLVTRGSQMAMYLAAHCLIRPGDKVVVEDPGYRPAWEALKSAGATIVPVRVDGHGLDTGQLSAMLKRGRKIRALYTTPHHQFPTTVTMSLQRRLELIELSNRYGFTIIEDDYDNEFHFGQRPILPLSSAGNLEHFVYIGSMSKVLAPALRIGYLASSPALVAKATMLRRLIDVQGDAVMEQALLQLIRDGEIRRHLRRATSHYRLKRDRFQALLDAHLGDKVVYSTPEGGLAFWLVPQRPQDPAKLLQALTRKGVGIVHPQRFHVDDTMSGLRLGYGSLPEALLEEGLQLIAAALK